MNPIYSLRESAGLTQAALADRAGLTQAQLSQIERRPSLVCTEGSTLLKLATALGVTVEWLLDQRPR